MTGNQDNSNGIVDTTLKEAIKPYLLLCAMSVLSAILVCVLGHSPNVQIAICFILFGLGVFLFFWVEVQFVISILAFASATLLCKISNLCVRVELFVMLHGIHTYICVAVYLSWKYSKGQFTTGGI